MKLYPFYILYPQYMPIYNNDEYGGNSQNKINQTV